MHQSDADLLPLPRPNLSPPGDLRCRRAPCDPPASRADSLRDDPRAAAAARARGHGGRGARPRRRRDGHGRRRPESHVQSDAPVERDLGARHGFEPLALGLVLRQLVHADDAARPAVQRAVDAEWHGAGSPRRPAATAAQGGVPLVVQPDLFHRHERRDDLLLVVAAAVAVPSAPADPDRGQLHPQQPDGRAPLPDARLVRHARPPAAAAAAAAGPEPDQGVRRPPHGALDGGRRGRPAGRGRARARAARLRLGRPPPGLDAQHGVAHDLNRTPPTSVRSGCGGGGGEGRPRRGVEAVRGVDARVSGARLARALLASHPPLAFSPPHLRSPRPIRPAPPPFLTSPNIIVPLIPPSPGATVPR
ncbi:hypothetical protein DMC30DRAFT_390546 [Rhodotorula diobovata]|uniref:Uncharacterized protein n=1 Tax=Rhodotorula diobovata TaxID=5288 RepID=A0A5C5G406_9BASI|nr:hypothetical protein DMC30DRAFT_390546 [Rhodotorula diobovata]